MEPDLKDNTKNNSIFYIKYQKLKMNKRMGIVP